MCRASCVANMLLLHEGRQGAWDNLFLAVARYLPQGGFKLSTFIFGMFFPSVIPLALRVSFGWVHTQAIIARFHNLYNLFLLSSFYFFAKEIFSREKCCVCG